MERNDILILDIETNSLDIDKAKLKWFGAYSYLDKEYYLLPYTKMDEIKKLLTRHSVIIGFNQIEFDNPIIERETKIELSYNKKTNIDMLEVCRKRLVNMGIEIKDFKLKTICETLKLDEFGKGDIDYKIFYKNKWNKEEIIEIKKYLKQDIILTKSLFEYIQKIFEPLRKYLSEKDKRKFVDVKSSVASLACSVISNIANIPIEWTKHKPEELERFSGGHHIESRIPMIKGNIVSIDFVSAYPHAIIMGNLLSPIEKGWNGNKYYNLKGIYDNKTQGKVELALKKIFLERLQAKQNKEKEKNLSYKIIINSFYGLIGNWSFKNFYNPTAAGDVTKIVRTWLKYLSSILEHYGYKILYGFTDNIYVLIPEDKTEDDLMIIVNKFINKIKDNISFPQDTFKLDIEKRIKFMWFVAKNCYLWVNNEDKVEYTSTLLNTNTPKIIMKVFNEYMSDKMIKELNINFTEEELTLKIKEFLKDDVLLSCEEYDVKNVKEYKVKTSLQHQISEKYGEGRHFLIPNTKGIGIGKSKSTKKKIGVRYCSLKEYKKNNLVIDDIDISKLIKWLKSFIEKTK